MGHHIGPATAKDREQLWMGFVSPPVTPWQGAMRSASSPFTLSRCLLLHLYLLTQQISNRSYPSALPTLVCLAMSEGKLFVFDDTILTAEFPAQDGWPAFTCTFEFIPDRPSATDMESLADLLPNHLNVFRSDTTLRDWSPARCRQRPPW